MQSLTQVENKRLKGLEAVIERGLNTFTEVGAALSEIRDTRLYRETHKTFEEYCQERWRMSKTYATRLVQSAEVVANLVPMGTVLPETERQARPLAALKDPEQQRQAWTQVIEAAGDKGITAKEVQKIVDRFGHKASVTYKNQPAIEATNGTVPLAGTSHVYTVAKLLWPEAVEEFLSGLLKGRTLHLCCGESKLGDVRLDQDAAHSPDVIGDAAHTEFKDRSFETVLCDPPYNGEFQWNHDLLSELARVANSRIVFQHWFIPADDEGRYKKSHRFALTAMYVWQPRTYFGRAQVISVFDGQE